MKEAWQKMLLPFDAFGNSSGLSVSESESFSGEENVILGCVSLL